MDTTATDAPRIFAHITAGTGGSRLKYYGVCSLAVIFHEEDYKVRFWFKKSTVIIASCVALGGLGATALAATAGAAQPITVSVTLPAATGVTVNPSTTALLLIDYLPFVANQVNNAYLKPSQQLLQEARNAHMLIIHTTVPGISGWIPGFAPKPGEPIVSSYADKYHALNNIDQPTTLLPILRQHGIKTLIVAGATTSGGVYFTTYESLQQGLTVVVPEDAVADVSSTQSTLSLYELLNNEIYNNHANSANVTDRVIVSTVGDLTFKEK